MHDPAEYVERVAKGLAATVEDNADHLEAAIAVPQARLRTTHTDVMGEYAKPAPVSLLTAAERRTIDALFTLQKITKAHRPARPVPVALQTVGKLAATRGNKAGKPVVIPFREHSGVEAILADQRATADRVEAETGRPVTHLFFYCTRGRSRPYGGPIKSHYHAWKRACARAGLTDLVLHDYRRTGCRNLTNAGVSPVAAMCITGHRTTAMFERYNIGGTDMAAEAMRKLAAATAGEPA